LTKPTPEATYERSRRLANFALWSIDLQCRRLGLPEPGDHDFVFRKLADWDFLIIALTRLRRAALLASTIQETKQIITTAILNFDNALP